MRYINTLPFLFLSQFSAHVCCGQTAGWIKMPLGMEVGLTPGHTVLDGDHHPKGHSTPVPPPEFSAHVSCGQAAGWIKMPFGREINLSPGNNVLDGDPTPPSKNGAQHPQLWPMYCSQTAGWIKMPLGTELDLRPGHIVSDGAQLPPGKGHSGPPLFGRCLLWPNGRPSQLLLSSCWKSSATTDCKRGLVYLSFGSLLEARDKHFYLHC